MGTLRKGVPGRDSVPPAPEQSKFCTRWRSLAVSAKPEFTKKLFNTTKRACGRALYVICASTIFVTGFVQIVQLLIVKRGRGGRSRPAKAVFAEISSNLKSELGFGAHSLKNLHSELCLT